MPISCNMHMDGALAMKRGCVMKKAVVYQTLRNCWRRQNLQNKYDTRKIESGWERERGSCYGLDNWRLSWENWSPALLLPQSSWGMPAKSLQMGFFGGLVSNCVFFPPPYATDERPSPVCRAERWVSVSCTLKMGVCHERSRLFILHWAPQLGTYMFSEHVA